MSMRRWANTTDSRRYTTIELYASSQVTAFACYLRQALVNDYSKKLYHEITKSISAHGPSATWHWSPIMVAFASEADIRAMTERSKR